MTTHPSLRTRSRYLLVKGLAFALWAGDRHLPSLKARAQAVLGGSALWLDAMFDDVFPLSEATWLRLGVQGLADRIAASPAFIEGAAGHGAMTIRRWILRPSRMSPPPLGLDQCELPHLDHAQALADWLGLDTDTLDWFTGGGPRRRNDPLHRQHHQFLLQPKKHGGGRLIEAPRQRLKEVQTRLLRGLLDAIPVHEACHGFVAGRSVRTHAALHAGQQVLLHFDLKTFFNRIGIAQVQAVFRTLGYPHGVARDLAALCTVRTPDAVIARLLDDGWIDRPTARCLRDPHLSQGAPTSPALANLCAFSLDLRLDGLAHVLGARYSRYADDLVLSGPASLRAAVPRVRAWVARIVAEEGHALNPCKTRLGTQAGPQTVCGVVVNAHPNLPRTEFDRLRAVLHQCGLHGPASQNREGHADFRVHLLGRIAWATQLNPQRGRRLQALWQRIDWPTAGG
jgi:RNA-directed DNA polymerase